MRSPALTRIGDEVRRVQDLGRRAGAVWRETASLHDEGLSGRARAARYQEARRRKPWGALWVGQDGALLWHDDDDRAQAMRLLDEGFAAFRADVEPRATESAAPPATRQWWSVEVLPQFDQWRDFADQAAASWTKRAATAWSTYQDWHDRLRELRSIARAHDLVLSSPEQADLPETVYQRAQAGRGSGAEAWWTLGRFALYTAVGVAGVLSLRQIMKRQIRQLREVQPEKEDPSLR